MADVSVNLLKNIPNRAIKTFDLGVTNRAAGAHTVFTVSGLVMIEFCAGYCREDLVGATATASVGVAAETAGLIPLTTVVDIDIGELWVAAAPAGAIDSAITLQCVSSNVILTVGVATITDGLLDIICIWRPLSLNASLRA
jgi:hypothetical protein